MQDAELIQCNGRPQPQRRSDYHPPGCAPENLLLHISHGSEIELRTQNDQRKGCGNAARLP